MLVYGDHREIADPGERLKQICGALHDVREMPPGLDRHAKLIGVLVATGMLLQGVADAGAPIGDLDAFLRSLADNVVRSYDSRYSDLGELADVPSADLPNEVELRLPEGFAFYAVYPEAYIEAARKLALSGSPLIIGIRSIGTSLAAVVAAALNAPIPLTVRPTGDPFARQVSLPPGAVEGDADYVIVDEGPGVSGSSFGSVADALADEGVSLERIAFLPSHAGEPGPEASAAHRARWRRAQRVPAVFDPDFLERKFGALEPFSTGHPWERLKYHARDGDGRVLLKFAGLGTIGERKLEMAQALAAAGFTPEPLDLVHGFLVERWREDGQALLDDEKPVAEIGRYLGLRAELFPAADGSGATVQELLAMCRRNIGLALGSEATAILDRFDGDALASRVRPIRTDNKLDRCEWLRLPDGRLLKADALDHHQAHDLVGCQDLAWDLAGAIVEFELDDPQRAALIASTGRSIDCELIEFSRVAYCAFRIGHACLAAEAAPQNGAIQQDKHRYGAQLRTFINMTGAGLGRNPRSVEDRNEPPREQSSFTSVVEEEASAILN